MPLPLLDTVVPTLLLVVVEVFVVVVVVVRAFGRGNGMTAGLTMPISACVSHFFFGGCAICCWTT
jgi:hypothetical protein